VLSPLLNCIISASGFEAVVQPGQTRSCPSGGSIESTLELTVGATFRASDVMVLIRRQKSEARVGTDYGYVPHSKRDACQTEVALGAARLLGVACNSEPPRLDNETVQDFHRRRAGVHMDTEFAFS